MNIDDLRLEWQQQFKSAAGNAKINFELLKQLKVSDSRKELQKPLSFEIFSAIVFFLFAGYLILVSLRLFGNPKFSVLGFAGALLTIVYLVFSVIKIRRFVAIDFFYTPVVQLQKEVSRLEVLILAFRRIELLMILPFAATSLPVLLMAVHGIDIYANIGWFIVPMLIIVGLGFPLATWINRVLYDKKLQNAKRFLEDINQFESDFGE
jgi:hypothetical protein